MMRSSRPEGVGHSSLEQYQDNLRALVKQLKAAGARLIWATTTPVPNGGNLAPDRRFGDVAGYNTVAANVIQKINAGISTIKRLFFIVILFKRFNFKIDAKITKSFSFGPLILMIFAYFVDIK